MFVFKNLFIDVTKAAKKLPTSEYKIAGKHPIIDQGQKQIAGYTDIEEGLFTDVPAIIFGDHTRVIKYIDTPFFIGADGVKVIKCLDKQANYNYLYYLLSSVRIPNTGYNRHYKWLKEARLVEHTKEEQEKIVVVLSTIDNILDLYSAQLSKLDELIKSRFVEMFLDTAYPWIELIDLIIEGAGLSYGIVQPGDDGTGEMGVLRPVDIIDGVISMNSIKYIDRRIADGNQKTELYGNELLITVRGTTGITALTDKRFSGMNVTRGIAVIRYNENIVNPLYLNSFFKTEKSQRYIQENTRGATLKQINLSDLRKQQILVPPLELQNQFADFVTKVEKQKAIVQPSIDKLETLKKSLTQDYFG